MGKLSVLGAARVEALIAMLQDEKKRELKALGVPTRKDIEEQVKLEMSVDQHEEEMRRLIREAEKHADAIKARIGFEYRINLNTYGGQNLVYKQRVDKLVAAKITEPTAEIDAKYRRKIQELWLCETLEEAKAIVGIGGDDV